MRRSCLYLILAMLASGLLFGATHTAAAQGENGQAAIAAGDDAIGDTEIEDRIRRIYHEIAGLQDVAVSVRAGVVRLTGKVAELQVATQAEALASRVEGVVAVTNEIEEETSVSERLVPVYDRLETRLFQSINYFPLFLVALLFWAAVTGVGVLIAHWEWPWNRIAPNAFIANLIRQLVRIIFFVIGAVLALDILGATALLGTILGAAGIIGLAVGFAVRDTVENYIASILLSVRQPFRPKDFIAIEGYEGLVISLTSRATILMEPDGNHIRIPNSTVFKGNIVNYSTNPDRRFIFKIGVGPDCDIDKALETGERTIRDLDFVLDDPVADGWIDDFGDSTVVLCFTGWINQTKTDFLKARSEAMRLVKRALEANGFELPEPTYRLRVDGGVGGGELPRLTSTDTDAAERKAIERAKAESATPKNTSADHDLERRVEEERDSRLKGDLLDVAAPKEYGES